VEEEGKLGSTQLRRIEEEIDKKEERVNNKYSMQI
jgi:hypothetical protein